MVHGAVLPGCRPVNSEAPSPPLVFAGLQSSQPGTRRTKEPPCIEPSSHLRVPAGVMARWGEHMGQCSVWRLHDMCVQMNPLSCCCLQQILPYPNPHSATNPVPPVALDTDVPTAKPLQPILVDKHPHQKERRKFFFRRKRGTSQHRTKYHTYQLYP